MTMTMIAAQLPRLVAATMVILFSASGLRAEDPTPRPAVSGYDYMARSTQTLQDDDFANPGFFAISAGQRLWSTPAGPEARTCADCHGADAGAMVGVATGYPKIDPASGALENLEMRINRCRTENLKTDAYEYESDELLALTTYLSHLSRGLPMQVSIDGPAAAHFELGKALFLQRRGQLDLACTHCHDNLPGERLRGDVISQGHVNGFPIFRLKWGEMGSRHRMFAWCNTSLRAQPFALGGPEYLALELYVAWRGNGLPLESPAVRR